MSLFIAQGSNIGDKVSWLEKSSQELEKHFKLIAKSRTYTSPAVDYENQPDFYNRVLEFETPNLSPQEVMNILLEIEKNLGRSREVLRGPRTIDLDILFWDDLISTDPNVLIPHPRLFERSFVVLPLSELPGFGKLKKQYEFKLNFSNSAEPISILT